MGSTNAYCCDGPACSVLTTKAPNTQWPADWTRLALYVRDAKATGSFHADACAQAWLAQHLGIAAKPAPLAAAGE